MTRNIHSTKNFHSCHSFGDQTNNSRHYAVKLIDSNSDSGILKTEPRWSQVLYSIENVDRIQDSRVISNYMGQRSQEWESHQKSNQRARWKVSIFSPILDLNQCSVLEFAHWKGGKFSTKKDPVTRWWTYCIDLSPSLKGSMFICTGKCTQGTQGREES